MPVVLGPLAPAPPPAPPRKRWTRDEIELLERAGAMEGTHYELVDGDLINKMGKYLPHVLATQRVFLALLNIFGTMLVLQEPAIDVAPEDHPTSNPEPDVIVLNRDARQITGKEPAASDIVMAVEVSDSTAKFDLSTKAALYARAGIPEYWVLDLGGRRLVVHRQPTQGGYESIAAYADTESVAPLAAPGKPIAAAELLG